MKVLRCDLLLKFPYFDLGQTKNPFLYERGLPTGDVAKLELVQAVTRLRIFKLLSFI